MKRLPRDNEPMISTADVLVMLEKANVRIARQTFYRWLSTGYFPKPDLSFGRLYRWHPSTVRAWLEQCIKDAQSSREETGVTS